MHNLINKQNSLSHFISFHLNCHSFLTAQQDYLKMKQMKSLMELLAKEPGWSVTKLCRAYVSGADTWQTQNVMTNMRQMNEEAEIQFCEFNKPLGLARTEGQRDASIMDR